MSSHHIIRENQEASVLLLNSQSIKMEILEGLLEWSPIVVVNEITFLKLNDLGFKVDAIICNEDFKKQFKNVIVFQQPIDVVSKRDMLSELEIGIEFLQSKNSSIINIICQASAYDMFDNQKRYPELTLNYFDQARKYHAIANGQYEKWYPGGSRVKLISSVKAQLFQIELSLDKKLDETISKENEISITENGIMRVFSQEAFIVMEHL